MLRILDLAIEEYPIPGPVVVSRISFFSNFFITGTAPARVLPGGGPQPSHPVFRFHGVVRVNEQSPRRGKPGPIPIRPRCPHGILPGRREN